MISVCMITHNGDSFIKQQIDSVLAQLSDNDELIISDDGSSDRTLEIIASYNDPRIKIYHYQYSDKKYKGTFLLCDKVGKNMENALKHSSGDKIFFVDQDDYWIEGRLKRMSKILDEYDLVYTDNMVGNKELSITSNSYFQIKKYPKNLIDAIVRTPYLGCCMAFNRKILNYALPFPKEPIMHDLWLGLIANIYGNIYIDHTPSMIYRRHSSNVSPSGEKSKNSLAFKIGYRLYLVRALIKNILSVRKRL